MEFLADTTLLIDMWREQRRPGMATSFAHRHAGTSIGIPWVVAGEFLSGGMTALHEAETLKQFLDRFVIVHSTASIVVKYAELYAALRKSNVRIGPNDLWIGACALSLQIPLITRNANDFSHCPELQIIDYTKAG